ncbi:MAG: class I SAM-dependent methyltransferase [Treponemataceae bacterium]|nr:class I SAM-dependent methyltransferase [Treponemataceae bacterium]
MNCQICKKGTTVDFSVKEMKYAECSECGSIILLPESRLDRSGQKARYELHENTLEDAGYRNYLEKFLTESLCAYEKHHKGIPGKILDFGSGPEPCLVELMKEKGLQALGWDPFFNPQGLDHLEKEMGFDLITCLEVAEHFENPAESFAFLAGLLKQDGIAVIGTNLIPDSTRQPFATWWYRFDPTHVTFYTLPGLTAVARDAGLEFLDSVTDKVFVFRKL